MSDVSITVDRARVRKRVGGGADACIFAVAEQALADSNRYVRADQWIMRDSAQTASDFERGEIVWDTPYAKRVYYTGTPSKDSNPNAQLMWAEYAHKKHGGDWQKIAQKAFDKGMK